jgi:hypothetical protein
LRPKTEGTLKVSLHLPENLNQKSLVVLFKLKTTTKKYIGPNLVMFVNLAPFEYDEFEEVK